MDGVILAVDFGLMRVGLATCDPERRVAVGAGFISGLSGRALARAVLAEARERGATTILIGQPSPGGRDVNLVLCGADSLVERLSQAGFDVRRWNEDFTTAEAITARRNAGGKARDRRKWVDEAAAILLLRSYLDHVKD